MEVNADNPPSEVYAIAPTGDVLLVVGEEETRLRVHSVCMMSASKVFDAMLGPHFSEGQPSKEAFPKGIPMPDDDARAMTTLCNVIHHRNDILPDIFEPAALADLALVADKYDCVLALKYAMNLWLDFKEPVTFLSLGKLLIAAYVFDNPNAFRRVTQRLITGFTNSYHWLFKGDGDGIVPWPIYRRCIPFLAESLLLLIVFSDSLETARTRALVNIQDILVTEMVEYRRHHGTSKASTHMQALLDKGLWGASLFNMTVDSATLKADEVDYPSHRTEYTERQAKEARCFVLNQLRASAGLCLRCVQSGSTDADSPCEYDH